MLIKIRGFLWTRRGYSGTSSTFAGALSTLQVTETNSKVNTSREKAWEVRDQQLEAFFGSFWVENLKEGGKLACR